MAIGVLALWVAGLAYMARRELFRPHLERLAEAGLRVNQSTAFYTVTRDSSGRVGYSSSVIDTTPSSITVTDYLVTEISGPRPRSTSRAKITLTRTMKLREFESSVQSNSVNIHANGTVLGDTALAYSVSSGGKPAVSRTIRLDGAVLLPQLVPLAIALTARPEVGRRYSIPIFDPSRQEVVTIESTIRAESIFVVSDSAVLDSTTRRWRSARLDTLKAWLVSSTPGGFDGWLDEAGHVVKTVELGSNVDMTSYEEAFENWVIEATDRRMRALPPSQRIPGWKPLDPMPAPTPQRGGKPPTS